MKIITVAVIKGGTGKTSTAAALAQAGAEAGKRILAIDLDPQANLTAALAGDPARPGSYEILTGADLADAIQETAQGLQLIPASPNLATIKTKPGSAKRLQTALDPIKKEYDLIVIDTPPQMGELTYNALQASTGLIIPLEADTDSLQGLYNIADIARRIQETNPALSITGTLITRYDGRSNANAYMRDTIRENATADNIPYLGEIRAGIAAKEARIMRQSLFEYAPKSKPAQDYRTLFHKVMEG